MEASVHSNLSMAADMAADADPVSLCLKETGLKIGTEFLMMFYIMSPTNHPEDPYDVPDYEVVLMPYIGILIVLEAIVRYFQGKDCFRFADLVINSGSAILFTLMRVFLLTISITVLNYIYENHRIVDLPLNSIWTWLVSLLLVEFTYYWVHRALHEFNILWAAHQFHHMAEDVNISTTIRDSVVDLAVYAVMPMPLAIVVPPPVVMVHVQFSLIYQIWLHNSVVGNLGFVEYIINTPRQHRVHHGKNPWCIDKNYGALLMIWDRMFGTYQEEKEKITFGVVSPTPNTYDSMILQFGYYKNVWDKFCQVEGFGNKMSALFKGPGWSPGKPRLGLISDVPEPDPTAPKYSYDPYIPMWKKYYVGMHGIIVVLGFYMMGDHPTMRFSPEKGILAALYVIFVLTAFGTIFDSKRIAPILEIARCLVYIPFDYYIIYSADWGLSHAMQILLDTMMWIIRVIHVVSICFWLVYCATSTAHRRGSATKDQYNVVANGGKDVESETSSMRSRNALKAFCLIFSMILIVIPFVLALMARVDSCHRMFDILF